MLCFAPLFLTFIFLFFIFSYAYGPLFNYTKEHLYEASWFSFWGGWLLSIVFVFFIKIVVFLILVFFSYILLQVIYIPFCSFIAEFVLKEKGIINPKSFKEILFFNIRMFKIGILKSLALLIISLTIFVVSFFPMLALLPLFFGLLVMAYDSFDYGLELYGLNLSERYGFFRKNFFLVGGHALVLFVLTLIPGLILFTLPFSVVGASLVLGDTYESKRKFA